MWNCIQRLTLLVISIIVLPTVSSAIILENWISHFDGTVSGGDRFYGAALDSSGNLYAVGQSDGDGTGEDILVVKYESSGAFLWEARYTSAGSGDDTGYGIAVDEDGNAYVTGQLSGHTAAVITIKFDSSGVEQWATPYVGEEARGSGQAVTIGDDGFVYVTGYTKGVATNNDIVTLKYTPDGTEQWARTYHNPANSLASDSPMAIDVDDSGNVYVTGSTLYFEGGTDLVCDGLTLGYDADGNELWAELFASPGGGTDAFSGLVVNNDGDVIVTGSTAEDPSSESDAVTAKYDPDGNIVWTSRHDGIDGLSDSGNEVTTDDSGNIYVAGSSVGETTGSDGILIKYDSDGNELWVTRHDGTYHGGDKFTQVVVDNFGRVFTSGTVQTSPAIGDSDLVIVATDAEGAVLNTVQYNGTGGGYDAPSAILFDSEGYLLLAGYEEGDGGYNDGLVMRYAICDCWIDDVCYMAEGADPATGCGACDPATDAYNWTASDARCDDDNVCTSETCNASTLECESVHADGPCDDGLFCNGADECAGGKCAYHEGDVCLNDGLFCNGEEACDEDADQCTHSGDPCDSNLTCDEEGDECVEPSADDDDDDDNNDDDDDGNDDDDDDNDDDDEGCGC